jgi:hypothetical protein
MKVEILPEAKFDLNEAYWFYERLNEGLGEYFLSSVESDILGLRFFRGHHMQVGRYFRLVADKFPFSIFYTLQEDAIQVHAVIDQRRDPAWIEDQLETRSEMN